VAWNPFSKPSKQLRARAAERHDAHGLRCALGELADLSTTGMRVLGNGKCMIDPGQVLPLVISNGGQVVRVQGEVVWVRKPAFGSGAFQIGVRFLDVRAGQAAALEQFAKFGCVNTANFGHGMGSATPPPNAQQNAPQPESPAKVEVENLYAILGVVPEASDGDIRKAFHKLAMQYHPDRNQSVDAADKFESINKTYLVLKDPEKRRRYDELLKRSA
jgi:hypothetical protein